MGTHGYLWVGNSRAYEPLYVGALKSNVGHLEGAAGVVALIKGVFTLERGVIPPNIWLEKVNPRIQDSWNLKFPTEATPWPQDGLRRMSINSFGIGGSNAHVVMDDAVHFLKQYRLIGKHRTVAIPGQISSPKRPRVNGQVNGTRHRRVDSGIDLGEDIDIKPAQLFVLSSYDQDGVPRLRDLYDGYLKTRSENFSEAAEGTRFLRDLSHTLASKRTHHAWRAFSVADSPEALAAGLSELPKSTRIKSEPRLAWVFTGQGAQWPMMGIELMNCPVFQQSILAADRYINDLGSTWSLSYELSKNGGSSRIDDPEFCQPICTALQIALVDLLVSWGVFPHAVTGHSSGEVAGAYATGALSREAAWKVAYHRGRLSSKLIRSGTLPKTCMAAVGLDLAATRAAIERVNQMRGGQGTLDIACMNSWQSHTVSGDAGKIDTLVEILTAEKVFARKLNVEIAYHSQYMKAIANEYLEAMGDLEPGASLNTTKATFFSSTRGSSISPSELRKPSYWVANLVSPVRFCESATAMLKGAVEQPKVNGFLTNGTSPSSPVTDVLEIGPHSALKGPLANIAKQIPGGDSITYHSVLRRKASAVQTALEAAGFLFCQGYEVDLATVNDAAGQTGPKPLMLIDLPSYPFNHSKEYWTEGRLSKNFRLRPAGRHELLGAPIADWNKNNAIWRNYIRLSESPWAEDHKVAGDVLYPAAGMLVMAIEASRQVADKNKVLSGFKFKDVSFHEALRVPDDALGVESHFCLRPYRETSLPSTSSWAEFQLFTFNNEEWREHCRGLVQTQYEDEQQPHEDQRTQEQCRKALQDAHNVCTSKVAVEKLYRNFKESGLDFGPTFQTLGDVRTDAGARLIADVNSPLSKIREIMPSHHIQPHLVHPAMLDGVLHANLAPLVATSRRTQQPRVPVYAKELWVSASPSSVHDAYTVSAHSSRRGRTETVSSVTAVHPETGLPMVFASGLVFKTLPGAAAQDPANLLHDAFNVEWKADPTLMSESQALRVFGVPMRAEDDPSNWMEDCETLCLAYIRRFLGSVTKDRIGRMEEHHLKYITWMEHVSRNATKVSNCDIKELEEKVRARGQPEGVLIIAVGQALEEMLGGPLNPLDVIFKDKIAENVYRYGLGSQRCYDQLCNYIDALAHKNPAMRILEVGAGTGGATKPVIQTLTHQGRRYQNYSFTDISPSFFEQAKEFFKDELGNMDFHVLNVENDPVDQGFEEAEYDLVVAANVLHATKKIDISLSNVRKLLKPGGKLLLFEITNVEILLSHFCFGVLPGWWLSEDKDRRWGPLMSPSSWHHHLSQSGFTGLDAVFQDFPGSLHQMSSILVSMVPKQQGLSEGTAVTYVVVDGMSAQQDEIASQILAALSKSGSMCQKVSLTDFGGKDLQHAACIVLVDLRSSLLQDMTESTFSAVKRMTSQCKSLIWVSRGGNANASDPDTELVTGLARVARSERPDFKFITVSFEQNESSSVIAEKCAQTYMTAQDGDENSFRVAGGVTQIPRLVKAGYLTEHIKSQTSPLDVVQERLGEDATRALALQVGAPGQLDTLRFEDDTLYDIPLTHDEVEFRTMACGLNPIDVAFALGKSEDSPVGLEAAGIVTRVGPVSRFQVGNRVFGLSFSGTVKTHVRSADGFLAGLPECLSWTEAAAIPVAYTTAYAVLHDGGTIRKGHTILIHSAATTLGQAALQLAQLAGAEVFASVDGDDERHFIETTYAVPRDHISLTKNGAFRLDIQQLTGGRGVDIVLNSLSGGVFTETLDCLAPFGRFVDILSGDAGSDSRVSLSDLQRKNIRYETFDLKYRALNDPVCTQRSFRGMVEQLLLRGPEWTIRRTPMSIHTFSQTRDVLRQMQSGSQIEKLVLEPHDEDQVLVLPRREAACSFDLKATYVIAGGLGGLGRSVARWMASRGAKNLVLLSRNGPVQAAAKELVKELEATCEKVATPTCDVTDSASLRETINELSRTMPPIRGCIQGSMVLKDNRLEDMTLDEWNAAVRPKVTASRNLFDHLGRDLDFFILLSSTVGITGGPEQANYAAGNTFQDALARHLASQGVRAVSLDLPIIRGVGYVEERPGLLDHLRAMGWAFMEEDEFHAALDYHCRGPLEERSAPAAARSQALPRFWLPQQTAAQGRELPSWRLDPLFSHLAVSSSAAAGAAAGSEAEKAKMVNHAALLAAAKSSEEAVELALEALMLKISRVLSVEVSNLDPARPLHAYGVDSLVAVELRSWLAKELKAEVSVFDMTNASSISQVASTAASRSKLVGKVDGN